MSVVGPTVPFHTDANGVLSAVYDPTLQALRVSGSANKFIFVGNDGILRIRMESPGGFVYDLSIDDSGNWVSTLVSSPGFRITETGVTRFLEDGTTGRREQ